jgi:hypothetical protein
MSGEPVLRATVDTVVPRANLVANAYDIDTKGKATMISRGAHLFPDAGRRRASFELYGQDWLVRKGHRIGVLLSGANAEWWAHFPTRADVTVTAASIALPFISHRPTSFLDGRATSRLREHLGSAFVVDGPTIREGARTFRLPPPLA